MPHDVFISYPSANKPIADAICNNLESKRIRCWMAPRDILPGQNYAEALYDAIDNSQIFILVFSEKTNNSPHIMSEVQRAFNNNCIIIPFRTEDILPSTALQYYIGAAHWLDAITPPLEEKIEKLADTVNTFLKKTPQEPSKEKENNKKITSEKDAGITQIHDNLTTTKSSKTFISIIIVIIGIILVAVFMIPLLSQGSSSQSKSGQTINPTVVAPTSAANSLVTSTAISDVSGSWTGNFVSDSRAINYDASLEITQSGNHVQGRFKYIDKNNHLNYVVLLLTGYIENYELYFTSSQLVEKEGFLPSWQQNIKIWFDLKNYNSQTLSGQWNGESSRGTIVLTKKI
jgi:hypothetical protein